jgi:2,4-dienoyl-CoA reductase-like NADH-dependent reductase (Old Yellow Enzyme family)
MSDPLPTFSYVISELATRNSSLAYLHLIESRVSGNSEREAAAHESNDALRALWAPRPFMRAGGFTRETALEAAEGGDLVAFGRNYISNVRCHYFNLARGLLNEAFIYSSRTCLRAWRPTRHSRHTIVPHSILWGRTAREDTLIRRSQRLRREM